MDKGQIILYQTQDGASKIEVRLSNETVWLSADQMAELFQRSKSTISRHIKNIFEIEELTQERTVAFFATVQSEGNRQVERKIAYYNLDMIISVGYRVNSYRGVQFESALAG
ncbi:MAG: virulence RhuM family protein [Clostridium sp.]|nr:virulence RhuM family protein [Clostridium sp.]